MNERIKELEKQAFDAVWDLEKDLIGPSTHFRPDGFEEKFSELIVKECVSICKERERPNLYGVREVETTIKQHFGVEE